MGIVERIFHAVLFEVFAVATAIVYLKVMTPHGVYQLSFTMVLVATIAMCWNFAFNYCCDKLCPGERLGRGLVFRIAHSIIFQLGLLFITTPVIAWMLAVTLWEALLMDVGVTIVITCYAFLFNFLYDLFRALVVPTTKERNDACS